MTPKVVAILPCNDLDQAQAFFARLGFRRVGGPDEYRMLVDDFDAAVHLRLAEEGWLNAKSNPFGLYLYREDVDRAASAFADEMLYTPRDTQWGTYEFAVNGPDETLVRVGWPIRLREPNSN